MVLPSGSSSHTNTLEGQKWPRGVSANPAQGKNKPTSTGNPPLFQTDLQVRKRKRKKRNAQDNYGTPEVAEQYSVAYWWWRRHWRPCRPAGASAATATATGAQAHFQLRGAIHRQGQQRQQEWERRSDDDDDGRAGDGAIAVATGPRRRRRGTRSSRSTGYGREAKTDGVGRVCAAGPRRARIGREPRARARDG